MGFRNACKITFFLAVMGMAMVQGAGAQVSPLSATTVPREDLMEPAELAGMLNANGSERPVIFQVGSYVMFQQAHIPNSGFAGPGSQEAGQVLLKKVAAPLKKNQLIVIYCGCCPWSHCPNIGPAYKQLRDLGFTKVKALYIAKNFGDDWVAKGYPTEKGQ